MKSKNLTVMLVEICGSLPQVDKKIFFSHFDKLTRVQDLILSMVDKYEGAVVKKFDGALLVVFESPTVAVKAGMELQRRNRNDCEMVFSEGRIEVKVAINSGEIAVSHDNAYGEAVTLLQDLQRIIDPGQVIFTEATYLAMNKSHVPEAEVGYYKVSSNVDRIKVYKIREEEINVARVSGRSLSFFGLLRNDPEDRPYRVFPAPAGRRVIAGVLEIWIGLFLMLLFSLICRLPQIWALWFDVIRIQAEDFSSNSVATHQKVHEVGRFMGTGLLLAGDERLKVVFPGPSGEYRVVSGYGYRLTDDAASSAAIIVKDQRLPYHRSFLGRNSSQIEELGGPIHINRGEEILIEGYKVQLTKEDPFENDKQGNASLIIDYIEFIPEGSSAYRPKGWEEGYKYLDFYRAINYDDMNLHFFLAPIPVWIFLHLFFVQILFSRTLGGMIMGLHIQDGQTKGRINPWTAFLRTLCWFLVPFWGWTAIGKEYQWIDSVSGSRVVVLRS